MKPVTFDGMDVALQKPSDWDDDVYGECVELPIKHQGGVCMSVWSLTWRERLAVLFGRNIKLHVLSGATQPPVMLEVAE